MNYLEKLKKKTTQTEIKSIDIDYFISSKIHIMDLSYDINADELMQKIKEFRKKYPKSLLEYGKDKTNIRAWHSDYFTQKLDTFLDPLIKVQDSKIQKILPKHTIELRNIWVNMYETNDSASRHEHGLYHYSTVYFPYVEENPTPLIFDNNGKDLQIYSIVPKKNMLICFPGYIFHTVPKVREVSRCSIAANYAVTLETKYVS